MSISFSEVANRKIFRWLVVYLASAWVALQVLDFFSSHLAWPPFVIPVAIILLGTGVLTTLVVAWYHGEKGAQRVTRFEVALLVVTIAIAGGGLGMFARTGGFDNRNAAASSAATVATSDTADAPITDASVAVLPFANLSGVADNEFFSDGITEEILNALAKVPGLHVAARTSAFSFKGKQEDPRAMGRVLRVAHILDGSVQRSGESARIIAKLTDARSGSLIWSEHYTADLHDVFAVEDSISHAIAEQLSKRLASDVVLAASATGSSEAHDLYLQGLEQWNHRTVKSLQTALGYFDAATKKDPGYSEAWAGVALAAAVLPEYDAAVPAAPSWSRGRAAARRALQLDSMNAEAHAALSQIAEYSNELGTAEREIRKAIAIRPSFMTAHVWFAEILLLEGRAREALEEGNVAVSLDPLAALAYNVRGPAFALLGHTEDAWHDYDRAFLLNPEYESAPTNAADFSLVLRRYDVALRHMLMIAHSAADSANARDIIAAMTDPAKKAAFLPRINMTPLYGGTVWRGMLFLELLGERDRAVAFALKVARDPVEKTNIMFALQLEGLRKLSEDPRMAAVFAPRTDR